MLNIDRNEIKDTPEYESFGENEFPLKYLSEEELEELGFKKSCCGSRGGCPKKANGTCGGCCLLYTSFYMSLLDILEYYKNYIHNF